MLDPFQNNCTIVFALSPCGARIARTRGRTPGRHIQTCPAPILRERNAEIGAAAKRRARPAILNGCRIMVLGNHGYEMR